MDAARRRLRRLSALSWDRWRRRFCAAAGGRGGGAGAAVRYLSLRTRPHAARPLPYRLRPRRAGAGARSLPPSSGENSAMKTSAVSAMALLGLSVLPALATPPAVILSKAAVSSALDDHHAPGFAMK